MRGAATCTRRSQRTAVPRGTRRRRATARRIGDGGRRSDRRGVALCAPAPASLIERTNRKRETPPRVVPGELLFAPAKLRAKALVTNRVGEHDLGELGAECGDAQAVNERDRRVSPVGQLVGVQRDPGVLGHVARLVHLVDPPPAPHLPAHQSLLHSAVQLQDATALLHRHRVFAACQPQRVLASTVELDQRQMPARLRDVIGAAMGVLSEQTQAHQRHSGRKIRRGRGP
jgi:hypothetical protein